MGGRMTLWPPCNNMLAIRRIPFIRIGSGRDPSQRPRRDRASPASLYDPPWRREHWHTWVLNIFLHATDILIKE